MDATLIAAQNDNTDPVELCATPDGQLRVVIETETGAEVVHGHIAITGGATAVPVSASPTKLRNAVLQARRANNAAVVYVGGEGITAADGVELVAGASIPAPDGDLSKVFVFSASDATVGWAGTRAAS